MISLRLVVGWKCFFFLFVAALGCSKQDDGRVEVYPVSGKVLVQGEPADAATVVFHPTSPDLQGPDMPVPAAETDENGEFQLRSYEPNDGAPAGEFKVTVFWPEPPPEGVDPEMDEMYVPKDRLEGRYKEPQQTDLTATVEEGGGELPPFELE